MKQQERENDDDDEGPCCTLPARKRHGARNQDKSKQFLKWMQQTFPEIFQDKTTNRPILDIAGGKGELSARMVVCAQKHVVLIDPREASVLTCFHERVLPKLPKKWQQKIHKQSEEKPRFIEEVFERQFRQIIQPFTYQFISENKGDEDKPEATRSLTSNLEPLIRESALLIGLHADSATEVIVDAALIHGKPFVVVPCCVFPNLFTQRKLRNQTPVRSHEQFCQYLVEKDQRFQKAILPFEGRNVAIYWDGKQK